MISQTFYCYKCTRQGQIFAETPEGCFRIAHAIGWRQASHRAGLLPGRDPEGGVICFRCPGGNAKGNLSLEHAEMLEQALQRSFRDQALQGEVEAELAKQAESTKNMPPADLQDALVTLA